MECQVHLCLITHFQYKFAFLRLKQCDLYHDVDCQSAWRVDSDKYKDEADLILGRTPKPPPPLLDVDKLRNVYCSILDGKWEQYLDQIRGGSKPGLFEGPRAFLLLGSIFGFLLFFGVCHRYVKVMQGIHNTVHFIC